MVLLSISDATLSFGDRTLFSGLDLTVGRGQLVGITGESGCGKTSLLRAILGFIPLTAGFIEVDGLPLEAHHIHEIRRRTAYVPQELQPPADTGRDLLNLTLALDSNRSLISHPSSPISNLSNLSLDASLLDLESSKLSGGQRGRLLLAAALALPKPLLLLDEPTSALDAESTQRVALALLRACHEDHRSALVVSHDSLLLSFCDNVVTFT